MVIEFNPRGARGDGPRAPAGTGRWRRLAATPRAGTSPLPAGTLHLQSPTDVGWDAAGNIFVADGFMATRGW